MSKDKQIKPGRIIGRYANRDTEARKASALSDVVTLEAVYEAIDEVIFTKDLDGKLTSVNEIFARLSMMTREEMIGKTAFELRAVPFAAAQHVQEVDKQVIATKKPHLSREWINFTNGSRHFVELTTTPLTDKDKVTGLLVTMKNLTELKEMLDEIERQNTILDTVAKVSALMIEPDVNAFDQSICEALKIIARGMHADRIDIWHLYGEDDKTHYRLEYEWAEDHLAVLRDPVNNGQELIPVGIKVIPVMRSILTKGKSINTKVCDMPHEAQEVFRVNGFTDAKAALIMPIILNDEYRGFIGAYNAKEERIFTENEEILLRSSRQMIAGAMMRMEITKDLMRTTEQLRYEIRTKSDFFARMSHEIRTPMNAILGMTELALRERMSNTANEHIMTVRQTGMNLLSIINDVLDISKIESGNLDIINADYALASLVYDVVSIIRMRLAHSRIRFIADIDSNLPRTLVGDEGKLRQILINLLSNSVKYTQAGFIRLTIRGTNIDEETLELELTVTDSGKGIKEEDQKKLFRDYVQVDRTKNIGIEGVGLGLSITRGLITAMNGTISLKSVYGEGSEFTVRVPQKIEDAGKLAAVVNPEKATTLVYERRSLYVETLVKTIENLGVKCDVVDNAEEVLSRMSTGIYANIMGSVELLTDIRYRLAELDTEYQIIGIAEFGDETESAWRTLSTPIHTISLANVYNGEADHYTYADDDDVSMKFSAPEAKILVVDDIETNLKVAAGLLSVYEVDIDVCLTGEEAIDNVKEVRYDIIFMDHKMPGMDGIETTQRIRAMAADEAFDKESREYFKNVPIVVLTANVMSDMKDVFKESGFDDYVAKPIDTAVMGSVMRKFIPKSKQRRYYEIKEPENEKKTDNGTGIDLEIPGVDVEKGFRASGGRIGLYMDILATFSDEAGQRLEQIHEYADTGNLRMYTLVVHALKGALANIGANELSQMAEKLESAGERKDTDFIEKNNDRFVSGTNRLLVNIKNVLEKSAKNVGDGAVVSRSETDRFIKKLEILKKALDEMNAGLMNSTLEELLADALTQQSLSAVRLISKHILMAEYDDAEQITGNLISSLQNAE